MEIKNIAVRQAESATLAGGASPDEAGQTIEERTFVAALICLEGHFSGCPPMGPQTTARVISIVTKTLERTHTVRHSLEWLSRNVEVWMWLTRIFAAAVPSLTTRSVGPLDQLNDPDKGVSTQESTDRIVANHASIKDDLSTLIKLMHISRNMLANSEPEIPQDICSAVQFNQMVYQTIILCVNVTSKGYDGEVLDEGSRLKLSEITELYKKLLVTALQQAHNWTARHDRNKMSFWNDILFDEDGTVSGAEDNPGDMNDGSFRADVAKQQVQNWVDRNAAMCEEARRLLKAYTESPVSKIPGRLAPARPLAWNLLPNNSPPKEDNDQSEEDRAYGRVSKEVDNWWLRARDPNYEDWVVPMPTIEFARSRTDHCKSNLIHRYGNFEVEQLPREGDVEELSDQGDFQHRNPRRICEHDDQGHEHGEHEGHDHDDDNDNDNDDEDDHSCECHHHHHHHHHHEHPEHDYNHDYGDDDEEDGDDDESYGEGPLTGLLTEVPNILDPKQIEALHMIVRSCILDRPALGSEAINGEDLQRTRCRMFVALDCGKSLLRELLVFIAVWEKDEQSLIFQVTTQIIEAIHQNALIPYTWSSLRIPKDIISPAQTVLLRLVNYMLKSQTSTGDDRINIPPVVKERDEETKSRDAKLVHFFYSFFRTRIVPECVALMHLQAQIREENCDPAEFPVDTWDMERAKDGLAQYLDFLTTAAEMIDTRAKLLEWEAIYDLITILSGLEAGVPKKPLVELPKRKPQNNPNSSAAERPYTEIDFPPTPPPPLSEPAHKFPWSGIKGQIFTIIATLLQPPPGKSSPGNKDAQLQMVKYNGIVPLLNCCAYDDHNPFAKERVTICLKWLLDGCDAANNFFRDLVSLAPQPNLRPPPPGAATAATTTTTTISKIKVNGIEGEVKVQVRANPRGTPGQEAGGIVGGTVELNWNKSSGRGSIEDDFMA